MKRKEKPELNMYERYILDVLLRTRMWMTAKGVAEKLNISWQTAKKNLNRLYTKKRVSKKTRGNRVYWSYRW